MQPFNEFGFAAIKLFGEKESEKSSGIKKKKALTLLFFPADIALHFGQKHPRIQTEVLGHSLVRSLAPLTRSLAPDCSLRSRPPLRSLIRSLAHFAHSLARGKVNDWMSQNDLVLYHSGVEQSEDRNGVGWR